MLRAMWHPTRATLVAVWLGVALASPVGAQPAGDDDTIGRYLVERGIVGPARSLTPSPSSWQQRTSEMVMTAMTFIDLPYRRGGNSAESGFDCSGFTRHIFQTSLGLPLPRRVDDQASAPGLVKVARAQIEPGDLVFFNTLKRTFSHVGIYVGEGRFIHAPRTGGAVRMESMNIAYWSKRFTGARRSQQAESELAGARFAAPDPPAEVPAAPAAPAAPLAEAASN
jgi:cell wall-associated NlpC family hydrolase